MHHTKSTDAQKARNINVHKIKKVQTCTTLQIIKPLTFTSLKLMPHTRLETAKVLTCTRLEVLTCTSADVEVMAVTVLIRR